jgi:hypothetical protein
VEVALGPGLGDECSEEVSYESGQFIAAIIVVFSESAFCSF